MYESFPLLALNGIDNFNDAVIETINIPYGIALTTIKIEIKNAELRNLSVNVSKTQTSILTKQNKINKISLINHNLRSQNALWVAGETAISQLSYQDKKGLFNGHIPDLQGFEYYTGGVFELQNDSTTFSKTAMVESSYVSSFDWRNRHGRNWVTTVKNQYPCGSCGIFAVTGAIEALINLYFNQILNKDLSEQEMVSCISNGGNCATNTGWSPSAVIDYIITYGISEELCFPYVATDLPCTNKCTNPTENIKVNGRITLGSSTFPQTEEAIKHNLIHYGPLSCGIYSWGHAMTLIGFGTIQVGDTVYQGIQGGGTAPIIIENGNPNIGKTFWTFKNSYGEQWGQQYNSNGFCSVIVDVNNIGWTYTILTPITSLNYTNSDIVCEDKDGDGYYNWGIGARPSTCPCCALDTPDGDDSDPTAGPMDAYGNLQVLSSPYIYADSIVNTNQAWSSIHRICGNLLISNSTLTLTGTLVMPLNYTITIQNGGELIVYGNIKNANINVQNGGKLILRNGGIIERSTGDEITVANGAIFENHAGEIK